MEDKQIRLLPRPPHPPGLPTTGAPPGFVQRPSERSLPGPPEHNLAVGSPEGARRVETIPDMPSKVVPDAKVLDQEPLGDPKLREVLGKVLSCSDLEDVLLGRNKQLNGLIDKLESLPAIEPPRPPLMRMPFMQHRPIFPHQRVRHQYCPLGAFPSSSVPGLFSGIQVDNRPKLPPPPGFEGTRPPPASPLQPLRGFSFESEKSPQPWSPSRQAAGSKNFEEMTEKLKGLLISNDKHKAASTSSHSQSGQVEENQDLLEMRRLKREEKIARRAQKKKEKKEAKLMEKKVGEDSTKTNTGDFPKHNDSTSKRNRPSSSLKGNKILKDSGIKLMKPENQENENIIIKKNNKKQKEKAKKDKKIAEDDKLVTRFKKEALKKSEVLKKGVFSSKIILSEDGELIDGVENSICIISDEEGEDYESENQKGKPRKQRKRGNKEEKFEQYMSLLEVQKGLAEKTLLENELRINPKNYNEAYISDPENGQDIIIRGLVDRNRSLEGDIVVVKLKDEADWHKSQNGTSFRTGKVVYVSERVHHGSTVGTLHLRKKGLYMLIPRDQRFPLLKIPSTSIPQTILCNMDENQKTSDVLYRALLISWNTPKFANGIIQEAVGKKGNIESETAAIFLELGLNKNPIPEAFHRYLPPLPYVISQEEIESRLDLRSEVIFTIDPSTARDLDDAVSIKKLSEDTFEVGVHISDVTHFLKEGTPLDTEVSERATTVYMVERAYHMLPIALCGLCSLLPGEDKLAISVIFKIDEQGNVLEKKFARTVINSCAQLSYDHAQSVIEGNDVEFPTIYNDVPLSAIKEAILLLNNIAVNRRIRRFETGALKIDQPKVCFDLSSDCLPHNMFIYELKDSHRLIEEFMLLANELVARHIHSRFPDVALLRRHDPPKAEMMTRIENSLQRLGIFLDSSCAGSLHASLTKYCAGDPLRTSVLNQICTKPMQRAVYFCSSDMTHHYALNIDKYTHFTSPIRRYADVVVHRVLTATLSYTPLPPWSKSDVEKFASTSNRKKFAAKKAGEMSSNFFRALYIKQIGGVTVQAVIVGVNSRSFDATIPSMAHNLRVYLEKLENVKFEFHENDIGSRLMVEWPERDEIQVLQVFCPVNLHLTVSEKSPTIIEARLLPPES